MANMKYLLNYRSFISLMVLFSFIDNFGMKNDTFKVLFVGDAGVGKTQIIKNFLEENFSDVYELTIGVEDISKDITIRGTNRRLQMLDCSGQEKYKGIISSYVKGSSIVFLIYDVTSKSSFDNIPTWISFIKSHGSPTLVLCGNKIDLENREVTKEVGEALAKKEGIPFFEVSAKTGDEIKNMIYSSVADLSIFKEYNLDKKSLVKELLQENENKKENKNENENENENGNGSVNKKEKEKENENGNGSVNKKEKEKENENGNGNGDTAKLINNDNFTYTKNTERCSLCSRCINCCKNCFNSD